MLKSLVKHRVVIAGEEFRRAKILGGLIESQTNGRRGRKRRMAGGVDERFIRRVCRVGPEV